MLDWPGYALKSLVEEFGQLFSSQTSRPHNLIVDIIDLVGLARPLPERGKNPFFNNSNNITTSDIDLDVKIGDIVAISNKSQVTCSQWTGTYHGTEGDQTKQPAINIPES